ncbi:phosphate ABC transporter substrate-binding protein PstS [candidate division WOR-3 bacterium]|nr:phosphate ABC transporter substrate-binding protein PstS [candidate division WOR-3 bacterium]
MVKKFLTLLFAGSVVLTSAISAVDLKAAGASFPYPFYAKAFDTYHSLTGNQVNYNPVGSGGGINQLIEKTVDFAGSDAPMKDSEIEKAGGNVLHIPTCLGAVVITYNLPGNPNLKLTSEVIAQIFLGEITKWNDPAIQTINSGVELPNTEIVVVHRADGSGTTYIFSDYLTKVSTDWASRVGCGKSLDWPVGLAGNQNPGVAGLVQSTPGSIGYVELIYALSNDMPVATIQNKSGRYVYPSIETVSAAANVDMPPDMKVSITDTEAEEGYPISGFTWILLYQEQNYSGRSMETARETVNLIWWMIHDGQSHAEPLLYAPLPQSAVRKAEDLLKSVTFNGAKIL